MIRKVYEVRRHQADRRIRIDIVFDEDRPDRRPQDYGFPYNLLAAPIRWVLLGLEAGATRLVDYGFKKLDKRLKRRRKK